MLYVCDCTGICYYYTMDIMYSHTYVSIFFQCDFICRVFLGRDWEVVPLRNFIGDGV